MGKMHLAVIYKGQVQNCSFCSEPGHKYKECPNRLQENTDNSNNEEPKKSVYPAGSEVPRVRTQPKEVSENDPNEQHSYSENEIQGWKWKDQSKDSTENQGKPGA
ncbi:unnamed protein product [Clavelina lepadiformis]|uniref:CCHC-type domain-containing protein n=1 Tax=Clavelina lepadiformis TaxID=159417 RepID=A0ABP0F078_CLALP